MRITREQEIGGTSLVAVRDALRHHRNADLSVKALANRLKINTKHAKQVVAALLDDGYIERAKFQSAGLVPVYELTLKGGALANATAARPVQRIKAQRHLDGFSNGLLR